MARLDRLGPAKEVAQVGAVIGSEFPYDLLHAVYPVPRPDLEHALNSLADAELVYVRGIAPGATYQFKHALIRDAAYQALLKSRRKELHRLIARTIDHEFVSFKEARPEVLARHWTEAGETEPAIAQWTTAAGAAEARNAFREALESYREALALLNMLRESPERDVRELELRQAAAQMLYVTRGYAAPETSDAIEQATALAEKTGNLTLSVSWAMRRWLAPFNSGNLLAASALADQLFELALREGSPKNVGMAHAIQTLTCYQRGDHVRAERHFATGLKLFNDPGFKQVPGAALWTFAQASYNAWTLGRANTARERITQMTAFVNPNNPYDLAISKVAAADLSISLRQYEQVEALAERALELSEKNDFPPEAAYSRGALGVARAQLGRATEGIALIRDGISSLRERGLHLSIPSRKARLVEALGEEGAIAEALETVEQALQANPYQLANRPEMFRLRGELRVKQGQTDLAEADFREAIELARRTNAKAWELRATMSLTRLLAKQSRRSDARTILADIYNWFTEGFDTADLKDAKALLDELSN
jgi:tetratricopeptide (TPR) repeat protein